MMVRAVSPHIISIVMATAYAGIESLLRIPRRQTPCSRVTPVSPAFRQTTHEQAGMMGAKVGRTAGWPAAMAMLAVVFGLVVVSGRAQSSRGPIPVFEPDPLWFEALPNQWVTGAVGGVAVDSHDNVWVFHRPSTIPDN